MSSHHIIICHMCHLMSTWFWDGDSCHVFLSSLIQVDCICIQWFNVFIRMSARNLARTSWRKVERIFHKMQVLLYNIVHVFSFGTWIARHTLQPQLFGNVIHYAHFLACFRFPQTKPSISLRPPLWSYNWGGKRNKRVLNKIVLRTP